VFEISKLQSMTVINITQQLISSKNNTLEHRFLEVLTLGIGYGWVYDI